MFVEMNNFLPLAHVFYQAVKSCCFLPIIRSSQCWERESTMALSVSAHSCWVHQEFLVLSSAFWDTILELFLWWTTLRDGVASHYIQRAGLLPLTSTFSLVIWSMGPVSPSWDFSKDKELTQTKRELWLLLWLQVIKVLYLYPKSHMSSSSIHETQTSLYPLGRVKSLILQSSWQ